jgi:hypothetical protein
MKVKEFLDLQDAYKGVYENQQLDEISSEVIARTSHKRMQNLSAAQKKEDGARDAGATMGERSKRATETSDAAAKVSKNRALATAHARSRSRMNNEEVEAWVNSLVEEGYDLYDIILSHLIDEGYAETEDAAESIMVNMSEEWREEILDEAITSEKGKAKAAEMIAARSTPSGRAKSGKGANVAQIRQIRGSGRGSFDREGLGGTPMTPTMAKNPIKKQNYIGTGNKAARRAGTYTESFNVFVNSMITEGVSMESYSWKEIQNVFDDLFEAQVANRNPDEYERKAKQGQSREQQLKSKVMGRMSQMDPDKKAAMLKQMRAVGLDV